VSVDVDLGRLHEEIERFGRRAFLLSVREDRPHVVSVTVERADHDLLVRVGRRSAANAASRPAVSLLWPAAGPGPDEFSLIVDGTAGADDGPARHDDGTDDTGESGEGARLRIQPTRAVLHRSREAVEPGAAGSDCRPVFDGRSRDPR
jgi:hypothetical protein